jgi:hypothetical protein
LTRGPETSRRRRLSFQTRRARRALFLVVFVLFVVLVFKDGFAVVARLRD